MTICGCMEKGLRPQSCISHSEGTTRHLVYRCWTLLCCTLCAIHASKLCDATAAAGRLSFSGRALSRARPGHDGPNKWSRLPTHGTHEFLPTASTSASAHAAALHAHRWAPRSQCRDMVPQRHSLLACTGTLWPKGESCLQKHAPVAFQAGCSSELDPSNYRGRSLVKRLCRGRAKF